MDIKEYISSGILESYVLGITSAEESAQIEKLAAESEEVKAELEAIQQALNSYALDFAIAPPVKLKERIINTIFEDETPVRSLVQTSYFTTWNIAATILLAFSIGMNIFFYQRWQRSSEKLVAIQLENYYLSENLQKTSLELESNRESLAVLKDKNNVIVNLKGLESSPESTAVVVWNSQTKHTYLVASNLPEPPSDLQYQLWAIKDGQPIDAGVFESIDQVQQLNDMLGADAFAITLEKKGGSPTPQGTMYVLGMVKV